MRSLDIATSALNEEGNVIELYERIRKVMNSHPEYDWRLIFCDNNSSDKTWGLISKLSIENANVLGIRMSRTFPLDSAFTCGIDLATADALIIMASDLQDPPEVIHDFLDLYEKGFEQVVARVIKREHVPLISRKLSTIF